MQTLTLSENYNHTFGWDGEMELEGGKRLFVDIRADDCPGDTPRDWDNLGNMVCWHSRYTLGDEQPRESVDEWWESLAMQISPAAAESIEYWEYGDGAYHKDAEHYIQRAIERAIDKEIAVILPLYLYDHSGITMRCAPFSCPWDSGQVGYIYVTKEQLRKEYNVKRVTKAIKEQAERVLRGEVEVYDDHLTGNVWGYSVKVLAPDPACEKCGGVVLRYELDDSCWGYYGDPRDYMLSVVNSILEKFGVEVEF